MTGTWNFRVPPVAVRLGLLALLVVACLLEAVPIFHPLTLAVFFIWYLAPLFIAFRPSDVVRYHILVLTGHPARGAGEAAHLARLHLLALDSALLCGSLLTIVATIAVLASFGGGDIWELFEIFAGPMCGFLYGLFTRFFLDLFGPPAAGKEEETVASSPPERITRIAFLIASLVAFLMGMMAHSIDLGYLLYLPPTILVGGPAFILFYAAPAMSRVERIALIEKGIVGFGYAGVALGFLMVFSRLGGNDLAQLGAGVALSIVSAVFMTGGSLLARAFMAGEGESLARPAWRVALVQLPIAAMLAFIIFAISRIGAP